MEIKIYEANTLVHSVKERAEQYKTLKEQFQKLKTEFAKIVDNENFLGNGAEAIKGFYQAQIDVADVWIQLIDQQVAFFEGIQGMTEDVQLSGDTVVKVPFLEENLSQSNQLAKEMVTQQQEDLQKIFNDIEDLISLQVFSKEEFDENINEAEKERNETIQKVNELDENLTTEYVLSEQTETYVYALFNQLMESTRKGENISPLYFNANAYKTSEIYQLKDDVAKQTNQYLTFKKDQHEARELAKEIEAQENRPWYEKAWEATKTFTGEITGYYDTKRAVEGVDPVTGRKLSEAERITAGAMAAAGFIPVVGWAGRAFKGGKAIYSTAKGMDAANHALDAYKTSKSLSILQKSEMGIYGLVAANGLSEAMLGKDMFGNELTDEQRQQSVMTALGIVGVAGAAKLVDKAGTNFPYSKEYVQNKVHNVQNMLKELGTKVGQIKAPTGFRVQALDANGVTFKHVYVENQTISDALQRFSAKNDGAGKGLEEVVKLYPTRIIDETKEAHIIGRVKELRGALTSKYKTGGNFALAEVEVSGLTKKEFYASSKIDELSGSLKERVPDISLQPNEPIFKATEAPDKFGESYMRDSDTEYKILNDVASMLGDNRDATGKIKLFTELDTCSSCNKVIAEFASKYPKIDLEVIHNNGNRIKP
ncbi:deaminase domain-containing protein [Peribacillus asahii]|uniref:Transposase n=1 Tax=Peribacillus asahii TaxID=228899 RepID=A0A3T0KVK8_9BACI|nr:deaminase domain-containing protein [Peribacillus asahii]AZV44294.1 transposase [Peribacillus asahii]USK83999.1 pre-toxin TG domain-containing protein [Peribacillus asahii]